jgi:hypothetical protein
MGNHSSVSEVGLLEYFEQGQCFFHSMLRDIETEMALLNNQRIL